MEMSWVSLATCGKIKKKKDTFCREFLSSDMQAEFVEANPIHFYQNYFLPDYIFNYIQL